MVQMGFEWDVGDDCCIISFQGLCYYLTFFWESSFLYNLVVWEVVDSFFKGMMGVLFLGFIIRLPPEDDVGMDKWV